MSRKFIISITCSFALLLSLEIILSSHKKNTEEPNPQYQPSQNQTNNELSSSEYTNRNLSIYKIFDDEIPITPNPMMEFNDLTKQEILSYRTEAVNNSIVFGVLTDYHPSPSVFQIEDRKPWISAHQISCYGITKNISQGDSRESIGILNPELLYYITQGDYVFSKIGSCSEIDYLFPNKITYSPSQNLITAYINYQDFYTKNKVNRIFICDANARDLGYNYAYADQKDHIQFDVHANLSNSIIQTKGFYHKGHACKLPGGCNNYSPREATYSLNISQPPAALNIKLWKDHPGDTDRPADITFRFIFE